MLIENRFFTQEFRSGGINIYPSYLLGKLYTLISGKTPELNELVIMTRILLAGILNTSTVFILSQIGKIIFKESARCQIILLIGFTISPMISGVSRIWYPDHYIIFFSSLFLYYLLKFIEKVQNSDKWVFQKIGISLGLAISTKYTGLLFAIPLLTALILDYSSTSITKKKSFKDFISTYFVPIVKIGLFTFAVILLFQIGAFKYFNHFIDGFKYNLNNYNRPGSSFNLNGILFYFIILFVTSLGLIGSLMYLIGIFIFFKNKRKILYLLLSFPLFIIVYLGKNNLVINRNMIIAFPFILPLFSSGLDYTVQKITEQTRAKQFIFIFLLVITFLVDPLFKLIDQFSTDFKTDSRIIARLWIDQNIPKNTKIMHNEFCSGDSPARAENYILERDNGKASNSFDYYIYNNWWESSISGYFSKKSLLLETKYSQLHYLHLNERNSISLNYQSSKYKQLSLEKKLEVINEFDSAGPKIVILKKIN